MIVPDVPDPSDDSWRPGVVRRAEAAAERLGFPLTRTDGRASCSAPLAGRVLATLAAQRPGGRLAEIGTGAGVGAAWISWGMDATARLVTLEPDEARAREAATVFGDDDRVEVVGADAPGGLAGRGPFDLLFLDAPVPDPYALIDLLAPGGTLVVDDVTPLDLLPADSPFRDHDPKRELFADLRLVSTEIVLADRVSSLLVGVRRNDTS